MDAPGCYLTSLFLCCVCTSMACVMAKVVWNDVLCFLASARNSMAKDIIIKNFVSFYDEDAVIRAKEELFKLCNEKNIARKSCSSHPNVSEKHVEDMLDLFFKKDDNPTVLPTFTAKGFTSMPPVGFEIIAPVIMALRDKITPLKPEIS